ncbi:MAG: alpha-N-acetylglucosaminidase TIM-barrel domain-containing protein [Lentimicrobiaceae bacterium]|nr:alpha-N-acetylglucosaminidase TIM-barrel domain-containing protein [Lentimicrobiaceae bacterium]
MLYNKRGLLLTITLIITTIFGTCLFAQERTPDDDLKDEKAATQIMLRILGNDSEKINFQIIPKKDNEDVYRVTAKNGSVTVRGSSVIAMAHGAYRYLQDACNFQYSRYGKSSNLPKPLPEYEIPQTTMKYKVFSYLDFNTFGNEVAYWNWHDWERELDFMAINGINVAPAMLGQEIVWQKVYRKLGISGKQLDNFFSSPAYQPWQQRGNFAGLNKPLPQSYIVNSSEIQQKILIRMEQFGMTPIIPVFNGVVPKEYITKNSSVVSHKVSNWNNLSNQYEAHILTPGTTNFLTLGIQFLEEYINTYKKFYTKNAYYSCKFPDLSEQQLTQSGISQKMTLLGRSIMDVIKAIDEKGVWIVNMSPNGNNAFENSYNAKKLIESAAKEDVIIYYNVDPKETENLKLPNELSKWHWVLNLKTNYSDNLAIPFFIGNNNITEITNSIPNNIGVGYAPENIYSDDINLFLISNTGADSTSSFKNLIDKFAKTRYNTTENNLTFAWMSYLYHMDNNNFYPIFINNPQKNYSISSPKISDFKHIALEILDIAKKTKDKLSPTLQADLVQFTATYATDVINLLLKQALVSISENDNRKANEYSSKAFELMEMLDGLIALNINNNLNYITNKAIKIGYNKEDTLYYTKDIKRMVLYESPYTDCQPGKYKTKLWSGVIKNFYMPTWKRFIQNCSNKRQMDYNSYCLQWVDSDKKLSLPMTAGFAVNFAEKVIEKAALYETETLPSIVHNFVFKSTNDFELRMTPIDNSGTIYYTTDGTMPNAMSLKYSSPINTENSKIIKAIVEDNNKFSSVTTINIPPSLYKSYTISPVDRHSTEIVDRNTLNNGAFADNNKNDYNWATLKYQTSSVTFNLNETTEINNIRVGLYSSASDNILLPNIIMVETSEDGTSYKNVSNKTIPKDDNLSGKFNVDIDFTSTKTKFVRITFHCHSNISSKVENSLYIDEITIK